MVFTKGSLLKALSGADVVRQLEALTWLGGNHYSLRLQLENFEHEPISSAIRFWTLSEDPEVCRAVRLLSGSNVRWVSQACKLVETPRKSKTHLAKIDGDGNRPVLKLDIRNGSGPEDPKHVVARGDHVDLEFQVQLPSGKVLLTFSKSKQHSVGFIVGGDQVIEGLSYGILGMRVGALRRLNIPSEHAFGNAYTENVPAGSDLIYTVNLLGLRKAP
jgi:hypothetical protein